MKALTAILILSTMLSGCRLYTVVQGDGRVSSPNGTFYCQNNSGDCSEQYTEPGSETLEAYPAADHSFRRWQGCDYKTLSSCETNISQSAVDQDLEWTVTAVFEPKTPPVQSTAYTYNASGQRITKTESGTTTIYQYDLQGKLIAELDETGHPLRQHVYLDGAPISVIERDAPDSDAKVYYVHTDHLDTPDLITDSQGAIVADFENTPFGVPYINYSQIDYNLGFPGQYYDAENGLHYNYYRHYDARLGRYIQSDPIGLMGGINTYGFVTNNPTLLSDPFGLKGSRPNPWNQFQSSMAGNNLTSSQMSIIYRQIKLNRMGELSNRELHAALENLPDMSNDVLIGPKKCTAFGNCVVEVKICECINPTFGSSSNIAMCEMGSTNEVMKPLPQDDPYCFCFQETRIVAQ